MYWFGQNLKNKDDWKTLESWSGLAHLKRKMAMTNLDAIITLLDQFSQTWKSESSSFKEAVPQLVLESGFSESEVHSTLKILSVLLSRESLEARIRSEFVNDKILDEFSKLPHFAGQVRVVPHGLLLHVTAGNVFLSSIDSLIMGFLTKNLSILKVSSSNTFFPNFFAQKLKTFDENRILSDKFAVLHWKGGEEETETLIKSKVNTIIAWGGEEMIKSYQKNLPLGVKLLDFGPKISFQVISKASLINKDISKVAQAVVQDIVPWNQGACASPQNLFLQEGIPENELLIAIDKAFKNSPQHNTLSDDEAVEILKETYRGHYSELMEDGKVLVGESHLLHLEENRFLRPSPLGRSLIIKRFKDAEDLYLHLEPFSYYLQSCSYLFSEQEKADFLNLLSLAGIKRFAPLGTITFGMEGAPHDGRFVLRELVSFIGDEARVQDYGEITTYLQTASKLKEQFEHHRHPQGYVFSSGGTTGDPKYVHFSYEEFDLTTDMLAYNFRAQGIKPGMTVANLFVAGNLWSSFLAVERALEKIGAIQLAIGGLCPSENILSYLKKFNPDVVMGIPSLLVMNAEQGLGLGMDLKIKKVFYAGEAMSETRREFLKKTWGVDYFGSAGYASVDAGVIGYQCLNCGPGEHHLFSDLVDLKIVEGEGIVSSFTRTSMTIKNYATGDRLEWVDQHCSCGRTDKKFKLLGRIDNLIQIWSCRLNVSDIEKSLIHLDPEILSFQIQMSEVQDDKGVREQMELLYEVSPGKELVVGTLVQEIYQNSRDLRDTISLDAFSHRLKISPVAQGAIKRNSRTGKISVILDRRK
jgi:phenylacetate-coenzyme A ligase PaaK-like adenylate-forming protein